MFELLPHVSADGQLPTCCDATRLPPQVLRPNARSRPGACLEAVWEETLALSNSFTHPIHVGCCLPHLFDPDGFAKANALWLLLSLWISVRPCSSNKGFLIRFFFFFLLIKLNLWLKRKLWLCRTEDTGIWGVGIIGILTLIQLSFPNWILRCVLLCFCRANVFVVCLFFSQRLFSFTCVLLNGNISNS